MEAANLEQLYKTYGTEMMRVCLYYTNSAEAAKDLLHDGFLKANEHFHTCRNKENPKAWIRQIFYNLSIDYLRDRNKSSLVLHSEMLSNSPEIEVVNSYAELIDKYEIGNKEISDCLKKLPETLRINFSLFYLDGFSHAEIAKKLHIQEKSSRANVAKAKQKLANLLSEEIRKRKDQSILFVLLLVPGDWKELLQNIPTGLFPNYSDASQLKTSSNFSNINIVKHSITASKLIKTAVVGICISANSICSFQGNKLTKEAWKIQEMEEPITRIDLDIEPLVSLIQPISHQTFNYSLAKTKAPHIVLQKRIIKKKLTRKKRVHVKK